MADSPKPLRVRQYGGPGCPAVVLHGGPGAPGSAEALARALADPLYVLEPWQRWSSASPLTVERHVSDLAAVLARYAPGQKPALVGESWGAMLALVYAARHPDQVSALVLVGCGTFDLAARVRLLQTLDQRMTPELRESLTSLESEYPDEAERFAQSHRLSDPLYTFSRAGDADDRVEAFDLKGHRESWDDMQRIQASGEVPSGFSTIDCPVLMLHGSYDPHPGALIRDGLLEFIPQLEYHEFERCGHDPCVEEHARDAFIATARRWLEQRRIGE